MAPAGGRDLHGGGRGRHCQLGLLPPDGGKIEWRSQLAKDKEYATQVDEQLVVVSTWSDRHGTTLYREVAGKVIPLRAGQLPYMDYLQIRPPFRSWVDMSGSAAETALEGQPLR